MELEGMDMNDMGEVIVIEPTKLANIRHEVEQLRKECDTSDDPLTSQQLEEIKNLEEAHDLSSRTRETCGGETKAKEQLSDVEEINNDLIEMREGQQEIIEQNVNMTIDQEFGALNHEEVKKRSKCGVM